MYIKRLEQSCIEDRLSKKHIREKVLADIESSIASIQTAFDDGCNAITSYKEKSYFERKQVRVNHLEQFPSEYLMVEIMIAVLVAQGPQPVQAVAGRMLRALRYKDIFDGIKTAAELLAVAHVTGIYDISTATSSETGSMTVTSNYSLDEEVAEHINNTSYLPPMICPPNTISKNKDSGYLTIRDTVFLGKDNYHDKCMALDVINLLNQQKLELYTPTLKEQELPKKPIEDPIDKKMFDNMVRQSNQIYDLLLEHGNEFHFCWKYDKRGRIYSSGYHVNVQASQYKKSLINLKKKELIV